MKQIFVAKSAGFCFGVKRAVDMVYALAEQGENVVTLGPIIHNPQLVDDLKSKGVHIIEHPEQASPEQTVVIRSHGVAKNVYSELSNYKDATCPFVSKIHKIVQEQSALGKGVIIIGDKNHPEVEGIKGHCLCEVFVISGPEELENNIHSFEKCAKKGLILVAQTTYNEKFLKKCKEIIEKVYTNVLFFGTICSATSKRQSEAVELAKKCDLMIIVGGRESSNTKKLKQVCQDECSTIHIETHHELLSFDFSSFKFIGLTAGASTPAYIIKEVLKTMSEILRKDDNEDFAAMFEQSLESEKIFNGKRVKGYVTMVSNNEVHVDIGAKQAGIVLASELSDNPHLKPDEVVKKGDEIDLCVVKVNDQEGVVFLSKKRLDSQAGFENIKKAYDEDEIIKGVVTDCVRGGILVYTLGTKIFVPASQCSVGRVEDLNTLIKNEVELKVIEINEQRNRAKGSIRQVQAAKRLVEQDKFWETAEIGKKYSGEVKSITDYGAFVDLGGIDGMIHITELSWSKIKHPSQVVKNGDVVEVYIKDLDHDKRRVSLGYRKAEDNPWSMFQSKFSVGDAVDTKIVSIATYGAFAQIIDGVDGLIHISQIADQRVEKVADLLKVGDSVSAKIVEIDTDKQRVSLSMRALIEKEESDEDSEDDAE